MNVLVVEDEPGVRASLVELIQELGYEASGVGSVSDARDALTRGTPDVCVTDLGLPDGNGLDVVRAAKTARPDCAVLVLTGQGSILAAVETMKAGAHDFLLKPLKPTLLASALTRLSGRHGPQFVPHEQAPSGRLEEMVGRSPAMQEVFRLIARVSGSEAPVMITGESGTGKEVAARTVHALSRRFRGPFVAVNCGAISPTLVESELFGHERGSFTGAERRRAGTFEMAQGGTLFLDEVTEMTPDLQVKFLRVLDTRTFRRVGGNEEIDVDVRLVASSNRDLAEAVKSRALRPDLFYRLNVFPVHMPPLRDHKSDIPSLASHFLSRVEEKEGRGFTGFESDALDALSRHGWPGNVRELRNAVHRAYVLSDPPLIQTEAAEAVLDVPHSAERPPVPPAEEGGFPALSVHVGEKLEAVEKKLLIATLQSVNGDRRSTAEILGISLKTVYNRLKEYGLDHSTIPGGRARGS